MNPPTIPGLASAHYFTAANTHQQPSAPFAYVHRRGEEDEEFIHAEAENGVCPDCEPLFLIPSFVTTCVLVFADGSNSLGIYYHRPKDTQEVAAEKAREQAMRSNHQNKKEIPQEEKALKLVPVQHLTDDQINAIEAACIAPVDASGWGTLDRHRFARAIERITIENAYKPEHMNQEQEKSSTNN